MYALQEPGGYDFAPLVVESHGHVCDTSHTQFNKVGGLAGDTGRVTKGAWIEGYLRQLSVALCKGNDFVFRLNLHSFCRAAGQHPKAGATVHPTIEVRTAAFPLSSLLFAPVWSLPASPPRPSAASHSPVSDTVQCAGHSACRLG
jgi:hypothetical protein